MWKVRADTAVTVSTVARTGITGDMPSTGVTVSTGVRVTARMVDTAHKGVGHVGSGPRTGPVRVVVKITHLLGIDPDTSKHLLQRKVLKQGKLCAPASTYPILVLWKGWVGRG